jgi:hypothetical protein
MAASSFLGYVCSWAAKQPTISSDLPNSSKVSLRSSAFRVPDEPRHMTPVDSMTMIPTDLYDRFLREGMRTKLRGQHNLHRGVGGRKPRLVRQCSSPARCLPVAVSQSVSAVQKVSSSERTGDVAARQTQLSLARAGFGQGSKRVSDTFAENCGTQLRNCPGKHSRYSSNFSMCCGARIGHSTSPEKC